MKEFYKEFINEFSETIEVPKPKKGNLGYKIKGEYTIKNPKNSAEYYVVFKDGSFASIPHKGNVSPIKNLPVYVVNDEFGKPYIKGTNDEEIEQFASSSGSGMQNVGNYNVGPHTHARFSGMEYSIDSRLFLDLSIRVVSGLTFKINAGRYDWNGTMYYYGGGGESLAGQLPSSGKHRITIIGIDPSTTPETIVYAHGQEYPVSQPLSISEISTIEFIENEWIPLCVVKLAYNQTALPESAFTAIPPIYTGFRGAGVTSVGLSAADIFVVTGSPVTTSGTIELDLLDQAANTVLAGPQNGSDDTPGFRELVELDVPFTVILSPQDEDRNIIIPGDNDIPALTLKSNSGAHFAGLLEVRDENDNLNAFINRLGYITGSRLIAGSLQLEDNLIASGNDDLVFSADPDASHSNTSIIFNVDGANYLELSDDKLVTDRSAWIQNIQIGEVSPGTIYVDGSDLSLLADGANDITLTTDNGSLSLEDAMLQFELTEYRRDGFTIYEEGVAGKPSGYLVGYGTSVATLNLYRAAGSISSPSGISSGSGLGVIGFYGMDSDGIGFAIGSRIVPRSNQLWTSSAHGARLEFEVTPDGSTSQSIGLVLHADSRLEINGDLDHDGSNAGFYGTAPIAKPTVSGSRGGNAALASLCTALANLGLITNSTS